MTAQLYLFPELKKEPPKPKSFFPILFGVVFILGTLLAIASWALERPKSFDPCERWRMESGIRNCVKWRAGEKVLK